MNISPLRITILSAGQSQPASDGVLEKKRRSERMKKENEEIEKSAKCSKSQSLIVATVKLRNVIANRNP